MGLIDLVMMKCSRYEWVCVIGNCGCIVILWLVECL